MIIQEFDTNEWHDCLGYKSDEKNDVAVMYHDSRPPTREST